MAYGDTIVNSFTLNERGWPAEFYHRPLGLNLMAFRRVFIEGKRASSEGHSWRDAKIKREHNKYAVRVPLSAPANVGVLPGNPGGNRL